MENEIKDKLKFNYKVDKETLANALDKAKENNIARNATELINFMLCRVIDDGFKLDLNPVNFNWKVDDSSVTTAYPNAEKFWKLAPYLQRRGLRHDNTFICNLLIFNFLHNF